LEKNIGGVRPKTKDALSGETTGRGQKGPRIVKKLVLWGSKKEGWKRVRSGL